MILSRVLFATDSDRSSVNVSFAHAYLIVRRDGVHLRRKEEATLTGSDGLLTISLLVFGSI